MQEAARLTQSNISYDAFERKLLERTKDGTYVVQYFYITGEKLTDPFEVKDIRGFISCEGYEGVHIPALVGQVKGWYKSGKPRFEKYFDSSIDAYRRLEWYETGQKKTEHFDGLLQCWYKNGQKQYRCTQREGRDLSIHWYENAQVKLKIENDEDGKPHAYVEWYRSGEKKEEFIVHSDHEVTTHWFSNGQKRKEQVVEEEGVWITHVWNEQAMLLYSLKSTQEGVSFSPVFSRKVLQITADGFLVQDFFESGEKRTEPYILLDKEDIHNHKPLDEHFDNTYNLSVSGRYIQFNCDGQKSCDIYFNKGKQVSGLVWYANGDKKIEWIEEDEALITKAWYENGQLRSETNSKTRMELFWYEDGSRQEQKIFNPLTQRIANTLWYENAQVKSEYYYDQYNELLLGQDWTAEGSLHYEVKVDEEGKRMETIWDSYPRHYRVVHKKNQIMGVEIFWQDNKRFLVNNFIGNSNKEGATIEWHENGQMAVAGQYKKDKKQGQWSYFDEGGQKQMQGEYLAGKQVGAWSYWDREGNVVIEEK